MGTFDRPLPEEYQQRKTEGDRLLEEGDVARAKLELEAAIEILEDFHASELGLLKERLAKAHATMFEEFVASGDAAREAGDLDEARENYRTALDVAPDRTARDHVRVKMEQSVDEEDESSLSIPTRLERLQAEIEKNPDAPEPLYNLGVELALDGFLEAAADQFKQVIELAEDDPETQALAYFRLANVFSDLLQHTELQDHFKNAADHYRKALDLGYDASDVHFRIGQLHEVLGDHPGARAAYLACLEKDPEHLSSLSALAHCHEVESQDDEALGYLEKLVSLDPEDSEGHYRIGLIKERQGDPDAALSAFDEAERVDPEGEYAFYARERSQDLRARSDS